MRKIERIYIHHSAIDSSEPQFELINKYHKRRGWGKIGYHFLIEPDGEIIQGRSLSEIGAHVKGDNKHTIGVCLAGHFELRYPLTKQVFAFLCLLTSLIAKYPKTQILPHKAFHKARTLCPGKNLTMLLPWIIGLATIKVRGKVYSLLRSLRSRGIIRSYTNRTPNS